MAPDVPVGPGDVRAADTAAVPTAPTQLRAVASDSTVRLTWVDGAPASSHIVTGSDSQVRPVGSDQSAAVTGPVNGQAYSFTVAAVNEAGAGPPSAPSVPVTPRPASPANHWLLTTPMPTARQRASAIRLRDGRVLVVGGLGAGLDPPYLTVCEIYDPVTATWTAAQPIGAAVADFGLVLLTDGRVLRTGGLTGQPAAVDSTEVFTPETGRWMPALPMNTARWAHSAVLLADGRVLVAGGSTSTAAGLATLASAELYDPATGEWSTTGALGTARTDHGAIRLLDGRILAVGGDTGMAGLASAELYDPTTGGWSPTGAMSNPRSNAETGQTSLTLLPNGDVLAAGGSDPQRKSAEVYRVATGVWQPTGDLVFAREDGFNLVSLLDGRILIVGGRNDWGPIPYAELYDQSTGTWTRTNDSVFARDAPGAALLADGRVLLVGGNLPDPDGVTVAAEAFSPL